MIWSWRLGAGSAQCDRELVVEGRQRSLRSGAWSGSAAIWRLLVRSGGAHCDLAALLPDLFDAEHMSEYIAEQMLCTCHCICQTGNMPRHTPATQNVP